MKNKHSEEKINTDNSPVRSEIEEALNDVRIGNLRTFPSVEELMKDLNQTDNSLED